MSINIFFLERFWSTLVSRDPLRVTLFSDHATQFPFHVRSQETREYKFAERMTSTPRYWRKWTKRTLWYKVNQLWQAISMIFPTIFNSYASLDLVHEKMKEFMNGFSESHCLKGPQVIKKNEIFIDSQWLMKANGATFIFIEKLGNKFLPGQFWACLSFSALRHGTKSWFMIFWTKAQASLML